MVVCVCKGLTDSHLRTLIDGGSDTLEHLVRASGAGTDCGGCWEVLRWMLNGTPSEWSPHPCAQRCSHEGNEGLRTNAHSSIQGVDREVPPSGTDR